ncbi:reverse transcriptase-like protein [[Bacillus] enclensis]|uniref:reverse transcriptase-like protein n=1 Tax=[Bacillus] enclensis TaxID=1402860 RepID=UPI0018DC0DCD|nr:reverse transcriptase-like protein [[Bacillus] enclensis]MBH9967689.1 reverse transcriptase-like protein [[Bacillus] enclensis]QWC21423.1 reverse transcriptase-like protein [Bacillus haikouensis]
MFEVNIDGASAGNPGPSGAGIVIKQNGQVQHFSLPLGDMDNHLAEFTACKKALEICIENQADTVWVRSDSQALVHAVEKEFVKSPLYKSILLDILRLADQIPLFFIKWVPSKENKMADELARKAIHLNG